MCSIAIFYFSGTGTTEIVANMIEKNFSGCGYDVDLIRIEDITKEKMRIHPKMYDYIGIGCPIIGYGVPLIVKEFIQRFLPQDKCHDAFIFRTAGGVAPINYNASKSMIRMLARRGYRVLYERIFSIGSNWITRFDDDVMKQLHEATERKVSLMCQEVLSGKMRLMKTSLGLRMLMEITAAISPQILRFVGKDLAAGETCTHCGLCIRNCPTGNIHEKGGRIRFKLSCNSCMRCVYSCPKNANKFRRLTFFMVQGGYDVKKILEGTLVTDDSVKKSPPPFFYKYIIDDSL